VTERKYPTFVALLTRVVKLCRFQKATQQMGEIAPTPLDRNHRSLAEQGKRLVICFNQNVLVNSD
jgi:hypothetical protein